MREICERLHNPMEQGSIKNTMNNKKLSSFIGEFVKILTQYLHNLP